MQEEIVELSFRGQTHRIKCGMGLLNEYIRLTGKNPFRDDWQNASTIEMTGLIVAGLRKTTGDKTLTIENVEDELSLDDLVVAGQLLTRTLTSIQKKTTSTHELNTDANGQSHASTSV